MRRTKIIATLGPKSWDLGIIRIMILAGADVFRLNLSHVNLESSFAFLANIIKLIRQLANELNRPVEIMVDTPGHKFRLGQLVERQVRLGDRLELTSTETPTDGLLPFPYNNYLAAMKVGQEIIVGDGVPRFIVETEGSPNVVCRVSLAGDLKPGKGLTARGLRIASLGLPHLTEQDQRGLQFAVDVGAEQVVMSYGTSALQMHHFIAAYRALGGTGKALFKYELEEAGGDLPAIVEVSDGGFIGQGDLGLSIASESVPAESAKVVRAFGQSGKPCIIGTQLLTSMLHHPFPAHGERAGIYYNVSISASGLMLSDETSVGEYPAEAVQVLARLVSAAEKCFRS